MLMMGVAPGAAGALLAGSCGRTASSTSWSFFNSSRAAAGRLFCGGEAKAEVAASIPRLFKID